jgi:hypothetical protein
VIRRVLWLLLFLVGWLFVRGVLRGARRRREPGTVVPRDEGAMVRDRVCDTFLPRSRAIHVLQDGQEHFFCSEGCRTRFLAEARPAR